MQNLGGAATHMQQTSNNLGTSGILESITYLTGNPVMVRDMAALPAKEPFDEEVMDFLNDVSRAIMGMREAKAYPDVVTFGFWIRKASLLNLKKRFGRSDGDLHMGRGIVFHIAPSNVPVNYAYSLAAGLLTGNANIVRVPSKDFPQVAIINKAIHESLESHRRMKGYICLIRYNRNKEINDCLSAMANVRVVWGGNRTISELRESPLAPRAGEITFADRYSFAVIDSEEYLRMPNKDKVAEDFYNDTYLTDQNACTSPRLVAWIGNQKEGAKKEFWEHLHKIVKEKYTFQPIMGINKLSSSYLAAVIWHGVKLETHGDNYLVRVQIPELQDGLMELKDHSGYFFEYDCGDILELKPICDNSHCQTIGYIGSKEMLYPLLRSGIRGVDRIVPVGKTMDFDLIWDGYDLSERLVRTIKINA